MSWSDHSQSLGGLSAKLHPLDSIAGLDGSILALKNSHDLTPVGSTTATIA